MKNRFSVLNTEEPIQRIIRIAELTQILGVSSCTLWRWRKQNYFPEPMSLGPKLVGWPSQIVSDWINSNNGVSTHV